MKFVVPVEIEIDINRDIYNEGDYINLKPKSEVNKRIREAVKELVEISVQCGVTENEMETKIQNRLLSEGFIKGD